MQAAGTGADVTSDRAVEELIIGIKEEDSELWELSKQLFMQDNLDSDRMERLISVKGLKDTKRVSDWEHEENLIKFWKQYCRKKQIEEKQD